MARNDYVSWARDLTIDNVEAALSDFGCERVLIKPLAPNDNSKNQIYLGADLTDLAVIPSGDIWKEDGVSNKPGGRGRAIFHAPLELRWITPNGPVRAPNAQLIFYPQYPEVRLSGILQGSSGGPGVLLNPQKNGRDQGRVLFLGVNYETSTVYGILTPAPSPASQALPHLRTTEYGTLKSWYLSLNAHAPIDPNHTNKEILLGELCRIHRRGWISSRRLTETGPIDYRARNGGGYTLEAELGILPNGDANPDFLGWEVKQHGVRSLDRPQASRITLMTPEPDGGEYFDKGAEDFVRRWGHCRPGVDDRLDFTGIHKVGVSNETTSMTIVIDGYESGRGVTSSDGALALISSSGDIAASWSFAKLLSHWKRKHTSAVYVPSETRDRDTAPVPEYRYGQEVLLGEQTSFQHLLDAFDSGNVVYDPGIRINKQESGKWTSKRRSQFRIGSTHIPTLYEQVTKTSVCSTS